MYEEVNVEKLREVLSCDNIPFEEADDEEWKEIFKKQLKWYLKKKRTSKGYEIKYTQPNKYGRYNAKIGLQFFQKDVRKYISGEYVRDFDFVNCHPVLLEQILNKNRIYAGEFLTTYNRDRDAAIALYNLKDKRTLIRVINNENEPLNKDLQDLHSIVYQDLLPKLLIDKDNKTLLSRVTSERKKKKKNYNHKGAFMSLYLQNVENSLLMAFYEYLNERNIGVQTLCFDGLTVGKNYEVDTEEAKRHIAERTGYRIEIVEKSTETDWKPRVNVDLKQNEQEAIGVIYSPKKNLELFENCLDIDENGMKHYDQLAIEELVEYLNNFVCKVNYPHAYGWRNDTSQMFELRSADKVKDRIRFGFDSSDAKINWKNNDQALLYERFVFDPSNNCRPDVYNTYKRPPMKKCTQQLQEECVFFDYLKRVICSGDAQLYQYLLNYIAKMVRVGKTGQALILLGGKGTGKSTFCEILGLIVGKEYHQLVNDLERLTSNFNSLYERCILTQVEEVVGNGADYHRVQNKLKTLITEQDVVIEKKGIDSYMTKSFNNFILLTNYYNPVNITDDNRRYCVIRVSDVEMNNYKYFKRLREEVMEHIEELRWYFYTFEYEDDLNSIRPKTDEEMDLVELNKSAEQKFVEEKLILEGGETHWCRELAYVYGQYREYCDSIQKKRLPITYFSKMMKVNGYITRRIRVGGGEKKYYVQGETERRLADWEDNQGEEL